ncbi:MAG: glycosyltransferase family 2 protein [Verrucomicrobia bacterium]|nr:glycosyltransferase family 2 protein [Verrucomicrobiota bacterium]
MLSSLGQQTRKDLLVVDVAHLPGNGTPSTETVLQFFAPHLTIKGSTWNELSLFQKRGLVRNRQLQECRTEWLLFADCDMVYHPEYFERLAAELGRAHAQATYMLSSGRMSNPIEQANALVDQAISTGGCLVENAYARAEALRPRIRKSNVGAGYSQLINVRHAPHDGYYVRPEENADWAWDERYQKARSDIQFRRRIARTGGARRKLPRWFTFQLIHLNHFHDREFGRHLEDQR